MHTAAVLRPLESSRLQVLTVNCAGHPANFGCILHILIGLTSQVQSVTNAMIFHAMDVIVYAKSSFSFLLQSCTVYFSTANIPHLKGN